MQDPRKRNGLITFFHQQRRLIGRRKAKTIRMVFKIEGPTVEGSETTLGFEGNMRKAQQEHQNRQSSLD
jgi:hypothetical protein